jgi:hypothetical protein
MHTQRTRAFWPTRAILAVSVALALVSISLGVCVALAARSLEGPNASVLGVPVALPWSGAGIALAVVGLAWSVRIFRGAGDEPPAWRHRDR